MKLRCAAFITLSLSLLDLYLEVSPWQHKTEERRDGGGGRGGLLSLGYAVNRTRDEKSINKKKKKKQKQSYNKAKRGNKRL